MRSAGASLHGGAPVTVVRPEAPSGENVRIQAPDGRQRIVVIASLAMSLVTFRGPLLKTLVERDHEVIACAPAAPPTIARALEGIGVRFLEIPLDNQGLRPWRDIVAFRKLAALLRDLGPAIVLSYTIKPVIYGSLAAHRAGVPAIYSMITGVGYAFTSPGLKPWLTALIARRLYRIGLRHNRRVFFQNPDDRSLFERLGLLRGGADQVVMINGSGIDIDAFRPAPLPERITFLMIARLLKDKGVREYVEAARLVKRTRPDVTFRLVGWIDDNPAAITEQDLRSWIAEGTIEYLGRLDDVRPAIATASVYVLPSYREGTPRTVLEAMAMGRPILTTDAPGCRETVRPGVNGYLVPIRDPTALAEAMERFLAMPGLIETMGRASREVAVQKYDVRKVNTVILETMELAR